jgi:hypothetical protein
VVWKAPTRLGKVRGVVSVRVLSSVAVILGGLCVITIIDNPPDDSKYAFEIGELLTHIIVQIHTGGL